MSVRLKSEQDDSKTLAFVNAAPGRAKRGDSSKPAFKRFVMDDLKIDRRVFRMVLLPSYYEYILSLDDPFNTHTESVLPALQRLYESIFPGNNHEMESDGPIKRLVRERFYILG